MSLNPENDIVQYMALYKKREMSTLSIHGFLKRCSSAFLNIFRRIFQAFAFYFVSILLQWSCSLVSDSYIARVSFKDGWMIKLWLIFRCQWQNHSIYCGLRHSYLSFLFVFVFGLSSWTGLSKSQLLQNTSRDGTFALSSTMINEGLLFLWSGQ